MANAEPPGEDACPGNEPSGLLVLLLPGSDEALDDAVAAQLWDLLGRNRQGRGLQEALLGLGRIAAGEDRLVAIVALVREQAPPDAQQARLKHEPLAWFLRRVAHRLDMEDARAITVRLFHLAQLRPLAAVTGYQLARAAAWAAESIEADPGLNLTHRSQGLARILDQLPPRLGGSALSEESQADLRGALRAACGVRLPRRDGPASPSRQTSSSTAISGRTGSLTARLEQVGMRGAGAARSRPDPAELPGEKPGWARLSWGLTTRRSIGMPEAMEDLAPVTLGRTLERLAEEDLDSRNRRVIEGGLQVLYLTGVPASWLGALGAAGSVTYQPGRRQLLVAGELYPAELGLAGEQVSIGVGDAVHAILCEADAAYPWAPFHLRLGGRDVPLSWRHLSVVLDQIGRLRRRPIRLSQLRGAIWIACADAPTVLLGYSTGCLPQAAKTDLKYYLARSQPVPAHPLHDRMQALLASGLSAAEAIREGRGYAAW